MPIYAYACSACGMRQDVMQKLSDATLTICPECGKPTFVKQLTAAGFQLKGSGYYVTDFKNGPKQPEPKPETKTEAKPDTTPAQTASTTASGPAKSASASTTSDTA